jgi:hypothetical protein
LRRSTSRLSPSRLRRGAALDGGGAHLDADGVAITRWANGSSWLGIVNGPAGAAPSGDWRLRFTAAAEPQFTTDVIEDILFAVSFDGRVPAWP